MNLEAEPREPLMLSVVIPVLDEASTLPLLLDQLRAQTDVTLDVVVADGGSIDGSTDIAVRGGARVVQAAKGRARQMNAGAAQTRYDRILFLHADSAFGETDVLARALRAWLASQVETGTKTVAGHFRLSFQQTSNRYRRAFRYLEEKSASNRPKTINGDQGLLIDKTFFHNLGGFDEALPFMEDQAIAQRIFDSGRWILLPGMLSTSARRFEAEGFHRRYILMGMMMAFYWTDMPAFFDRAKDVYPQHKYTRTLHLWPYFKVMWQILIRDSGVRGSLRLAYRMGRYARQNFWQLFFFLDVNLPSLSRHRHPFTRFHDRFIQPLTDNRVADVLIASFVIVWYLLVLGPTFYLLDKRQGSFQSPPDL